MHENEDPIPSVTFMHNGKQYSIKMSSFLSSPLFYSEFIKNKNSILKFNDSFKEEIFAKAILILNGQYLEIKNQETSELLKVIEHYQFHHILPVIQAMSNDLSINLSLTSQKRTIEEIYNSLDNIENAVEEAISIDPYKAISIISNPKHAGKVARSPNAIRLLEDALSNDMFEVSIRPRPQEDKEPLETPLEAENHNQRDTPNEEVRELLFEVFDPLEDLIVYKNEDRASIEYKIYRLSHCFVPDIMDQSINFFVKDTLRILLSQEFRRSQLAIALSRDDVDEVKRLYSMKLIDKDTDGVNTLHLAILYEAIDCISFLIGIFTKANNRYRIGLHHVAAIANSTVSLSIIANNASTFENDPYGQSADHYLAHFSDSNDTFLYYLRWHQITVGEKDMFGQNAISIAISSNANLLLTNLIAHSQKEEAEDYLSFATKLGNDTAVKLINDALLSSEQNEFDDLIQTEGIKYGDETCERIIKSLERINFANFHRLEHLIKMVKNGLQEEIVMYIIMRLASVLDFNMTMDGRSILVIMISNGFGLESIKKVIEMGARMDVVVHSLMTPVYPIYYIAKYSNQWVFNYFVERNERELYRPSGLGRTLIHWSIEHEIDDVGLGITRSIIDKDPMQLTQADIFGKTTLHSAAENQKVEVLQMILKMYVSNREIYQSGFVNQPDMHKLDTPLHIACMYTNWKVISIILMFPDIDLYAEDINGRTPIERVASPERLSYILRKFRRHRSFRNKVMKGCEEFLKRWNSRHF